MKTLSQRSKLRIVSKADKLGFQSSQTHGTAECENENVSPESTQR